MIRFLARVHVRVHFKMRTLRVRLATSFVRTSIDATFLDLFEILAPIPLRLAHVHRPLLDRRHVRLVQVDLGLE